MFKYLKYSLVYLLVLPLIFGLLMGGNGLLLGFISGAGLIIIGDLLLGDDLETPKYNHPWLLNIQLYIALLFVFLINLLLIWSFAETDILGIGSKVYELTGYDAISAREQNTTMGYLFAVLGCGLMTAVVGTNVGHELTHRTNDPVAMIIGRWLLAFSWDSGFSIEHVYGHHLYVGSINDPATAPRGRSVYAHILISTYKGNISAWLLEKTRLSNRSQPIFGFQNRYLRGIMMSIALEALAFLAAGWIGVMVFSASALIAKAYLEIVNYMEHYGVVRDPNSPVQPYHSWNSNKRVSSWATFNLTRHSHHHAKGDVPYHKLNPYPDAPMMINGYLSTIFLTLIPPLWHALMIPKLIDWDQRYASEEELLLVEKANQKSGLKQLQTQN